MPSNALSAQGMKFQVSTETSPTNLQDVPEVSSIQGPSGSANLIDKTNLASTGKEFLTGLKDEGEVSLTIRYIPDNTIHQRLRALFSSSGIGEFRIEFTDTAPTTKWTFAGYVSGFSVSGAVDALLEAQVTVKVTGAIVES